MKSNKPIPRAWFDCSSKWCTEGTYPADMLHWYALESRWMCDSCWDNLPPLDEECEIMPEQGISLEEYLSRIGSGHLRAMIYDQPNYGGHHAENKA